MEQFVDFTYMQDIDIGSKANMSFRLRSLLNENIDLAKYGDTIESIHFSPLIGSVLTPDSEYFPYEKQLNLEFYIDPEEAIDLEEQQFFQLLLDEFIKAMEEMELPEGFDLDSFKEDLRTLQFNQLAPIV